MTATDSLAAIKWPNVPACYGWLSLDRRGHWRLKGEVIRHAGLIAFINSQYGADDFGNWIFHNGPQRVYVSLDYAPLVWHMDGQGRLFAHTGAAAGAVREVCLDEDGNVLLQAELGIGLLDDRDLAAFLEACRASNGGPAGHEALLSVTAGRSEIFWRGISLQAIRRSDVARRFAFQPTPGSSNSEDDAR